MGDNPDQYQLLNPGELNPSDAYNNSNNVNNQLNNNNNNNKHRILNKLREIDNLQQKIAGQKQREQVHSI